MTIQINMQFDTVQDAIKGLHDLAASFLSATSSHTLDNAQQNRHIDTASPVEAAESLPSDPPKRGRGRPPKAKAQEETVSSPPASEPAGEASFSQPEQEPEQAPAATEQEVQEVIAALTEKYRGSGPADREAIRKWRDGLGLDKMADLKPDHVPAARQLLEDLESK